MSTQTDNFINKVKSGATALWSIYGILPSVAIAQAALESAWGQSGLAIKYNNLFGIKGSYGGNSAAMETWEVYGGVRYDIVDSFRAYPDWETSIKDYGVFLNVNSRYGKAIGLKDSKAQIKEIHEAGYATDPDYQTKINSIIATYNLTQYDKQVLNATSVKTETQTTQGVINMSGTFVANDTIMVRDQPTTKGKHIATYKKGESVKYDKAHFKNSYVWLEYTRAVGGKGYIPIAPLKELWGTLK